jgi:hypothetical protein
MGFRSCGFVPASDGYIGEKLETNRSTENIQKHEQVRKMFFLLLIEILFSDFLYD